MICSTINKPHDSHVCVPYTHSGQLAAKKKEKKRKKKKNQFTPNIIFKDKINGLKIATVAN